MYRNRTLEERAAKGLSRAVPDRFVHFYKRLDGTHQQEVRLSQLHAYTVPHKVESKRGFEFYQLPYYDERTDQEHGGQPQIELSEKTKTEFRWVLENCLRRGIQVSLWYLTSLGRDQMIPEHFPLARRVDECVHRARNRRNHRARVLHLPGETSRRRVPIRVPPLYLDRPAPRARRVPCVTAL